MSDQVERGRCPNCKRQIALWQAVAIGPRRPFACRQCGALIEKTSGRYIIVAPLILSMTLLTNRVGFQSPTLWIGILAACLVIILDSWFVGPVRRSVPSAKT